MNASSAQVVAIPGHSPGPLARLVARSGRWSMYRWTAAGLALVEVCALGAAATGQLLAGPIDLLVSLAVAVAVSIVANRACAALWHAPVRDESALVTGLIVHLVAWPGTDRVSLLAVVVAAGIAAVSKYALVVRGRRLVNPAAVGLAVSGLVGLGSGSWWVATPVLLPMVAVTGLLVLQRSATWPAAAGAFITGLVGLTVWLAGSGASVPQAAASALGSYPVVFWAAFMVTDPQLLPARRLHQVVAGVASGIALAIPFSLSIGALTVSSSPATAVLVGNLVALGLRARRSRAVDARAGATRSLGGDIVEVDLITSRPISIEAGQYVEMTAPSGPWTARGNRRAFTPTSTTGTPGTGLQIVFRAGEPLSSFKRSLLTDGAPLRLEGVRGDLTLPGDPGIPLVLLAGGVGITPFIAFANQLRARGEVRDVVLIHCVRHVDEIIHPEVLSGFRVIVVSPDTDGKLPEDWLRFAGSVPDAEALKRLCPDIGKRLAYVAGSPRSVARYRRALRAAGVLRVRSEALVGI